MIKSNKWKLIISSIVILLPILFGLAFWNELPDQMITHWGIDGNPDGFNNRYVAVFTLPVLILLVHWFCIFFTSKDPKNKNQNNKVFGIVIWITPIVSLIAHGMIYAVSFGKEFHPHLITTLLIGGMFVIIGNYLPKCKQNYTMGIKVKWTLENEENWNATHRFSGKVWFIGGLILMFCIFLPQAVLIWIMFISIFILVVIPILYSYFYHRKQVKEGSADVKTLPKSKVNRIITIISLIIITLILIFLGIIMFSGDIDVKYSENSFTIQASYWNDLTIEYDAIKNVEYRTNDNPGLRTYGFGSARLLMGAFRNEEFGNYTRYSYTKSKSCVVVNVDEKILVINGIDDNSTMEIYANIKEKIWKR